MGKKIEFMHKVMTPYTLISFEGLFVQSAPSTVCCEDIYIFERNAFIFLTSYSDINTVSVVFIPRI